MCFPIGSRLSEFLEYHLFRPFHYRLPCVTYLHISWLGSCASFLVSTDFFIQATNGGIKSAFAQQYNKLQHETKTQTQDVLGIYYRDLDQLLMSRGNSNILIMGDFNQTSSSEEILGLQEQHNLMDFYEYVHSMQQFATHIRGAKELITCWGHRRSCH